MLDLIIFLKNNEVIYFFFLGRKINANFSNVFYFNNNSHLLCIQQT